VLSVTVSDLFQAQPFSLSIRVPFALSNLGFTSICFLDTSSLASFVRIYSPRICSTDSVQYFHISCAILCTVSLQGKTTLEKQVKDVHCWLFDIELCFLFGVYRYFFLILSLLLAIFGWKLLYLVSFVNVKVPFLRSKFQITTMTVALVFIFSSRALKDFLSGLNIGSLTYQNPYEESLLMQLLLFSLMFVWEVIPATLVIVLFWRIPNTAVHSSTLTSSIAEPSTPPETESTTAETQQQYRDPDQELNDGNIQNSLVNSEVNNETTPSRDFSPQHNVEQTRQFYRRFPSFAVSNTTLTGYNTISPLLDE